MRRLMIIFGFAALFQTTAGADPAQKDKPSHLSGFRLGLSSPEAIQGSLSAQQKVVTEPSRYRFFVHAYGPVKDGKVVALAESNMCPTITVRASQPLKPGVEYVFVGQDAGEPEPVFVVTEIVSVTPK